jgi:hypothetical protein
MFPVRTWPPIVETSSRSSPADFLGFRMATASGFSLHGQTPKSLLTLAEYLELALDKGECVLLVRQGADICAVYIGDPTGSRDDLAGHGTIPATLADDMLELTKAGANRITIGDQPYRFRRSFTQIADVGAVVFTPA